MYDVVCPLCGGVVGPDSRGRLDCAAGHRFNDPDLWRSARMEQLIADIAQFLHPDEAPACPAHRWQVTEVRGEFVAAQCAFCTAVAVSVRRDVPGPAWTRDETGT